MIEISGLTKQFGPITAVAGIDLAVGKGAVLGFLGPNGAGKSTTMKRVAGYLAPSSGTVRVCGHDVEADTIGAQREIGYLPEGAPAYGDMTPRQFLKFIARVRGFSGEQAKSAVATAVAKTELDPVLDQTIDTLSKGFKRRVGLAQAILHDPPVLIMDEPTAEGPVKQLAKIYAAMPAKGACGATTIACNLAFQWKRLGAKKILLADLDPLTGTLSFLLKIKSIYSFLDTLQRAHELDDDLWNAMVTPVQGVDVLLAPEIMVEATQDLRDPTPILDYARHIYDVIVLDTSTVYGDWNLNQARQANELLLVTTNELPALQAAQRALSYLDTNRIGR